MRIAEVISALERFAPLPLQDGYDNAGLQVGLTDAEVTGALLCLDVTEDVLDEAHSLGFNLVVSHHPLLFHGLKQISGRSHVERCVMKAISLGIAVCSMHTNMDNASGGVSFKMAERLGLEGITFLQQTSDGAGAGVTGTLPDGGMTDADFLQRLKDVFHAGCVLHTQMADGHRVRRVALCGGAGAFLIADAVASGADAFVTGEIKYHEFLDHSGDIMLAAIGHYESEQYTTEIFERIIKAEFPALPVRTTKVMTNPVRYL